MTEAIALRPVQPEDGPVFARLTNDPDGTGPFEWHGWNDLPTGPQAMEQRQISERGGTLAVVLGDEMIGMVSWRRVGTRPGSHCWAVGIGLLPEARGSGHGTEAQRLLVRYLFAHTQVNRIEASTEVDNIGEQRALEKAGFTREGTLRGYGWREGAWRDDYLYSILRSEVDLGVTRR